MPKTIQHRIQTLRNAPHYPPIDEPLQQAIATCESCGGSHATTVRVTRPWHSQAETLAVEYHFSDPSARSLRVEVSCANAGRRLSVDLNSPLPLLPVTLEKPWGREIWYTGVEARGESQVLTAEGPLDLHSYLSLAPDHLCGRAPLVLLKALQSKPEPLLGELYFEIHQHKQEVYVVTDIDRSAHPDGIGNVRLGVNQTLRRSYPNDDAFRAAFSAAARDYETVRDEADRQAGNRSTATLTETEQQARERVLEFTAAAQLRPGDVLAVPAGVPHALQHGIRVLEFQTPDFERQIIYSTQKVLTQPGWDSARAIAGMNLETPTPPRSILTDEQTQTIAEFPQFSVFHARLERDQHDELTDTGTYAVCYALDNPVRIEHAGGSLTLAPASAAFIPASAQQVRFTADTAAAVLIAAPVAC